MTGSSGGGEHTAGLDYRRSLARHALGLPNAQGRSYRNRFVAGPGHADYEHWLALTKLGYAVRREGGSLPFGGSDLFYLTPLGAEGALDFGETLCPEDFPALTKASEPRHD